MESKLPPDLTCREDVGAEVGFLIMYSANLDGWLTIILSELLRDREAAAAIMWNVDNLSARLGIVFSIAAQRSDDPFATIIMSHKEALERAIGYRNRLAHGIYAWSDEMQLCLMKGGTSSRRGAASAEILDLKQIRAHTDDIRSAMKAILNGATMTLTLEDPDLRAALNKHAQRIPIYDEPVVDLTV